MMRLHPGDLYQRDDNMDLSIHYFCRFGDAKTGHSDIIENMIKQNPQSLLEMDSLGKLSLHIDEMSHCEERIRVNTLLVDNIYLETLKQDRDTDEDYENTLLLHKAAFILHLCTPYESAVMFCLLMELLFDGIESEHLSRLFLHRDDKGNTFLHLLWNRIGKSGLVPSLCKTMGGNDQQRHKYLDRG
jgi:hypothetical protein